MKEFLNLMYLRYIEFNPHKYEKNIDLRTGNGYDALVLPVLR